MKISRIAVSAVVLALTLALVPIALAAKGGNNKGGGAFAAGSGNSLSLVMVNDLNGNGLPDWGDTITFSVSTSATWPSVEADCVQNGASVYQGIAGFYPSSGSRDYTLQSYSWTGGAADCTATLYVNGNNGSQQTLASLSFPVGA
jgi:hypothetical protein